VQKFKCFSCKSNGWWAMTWTLYGKRQKSLKRRHYQIWHFSWIVNIWINIKVSKFILFCNKTYIYSGLPSENLMCLCLFITKLWPFSFGPLLMGHPVFQDVVPILLLFVTIEGEYPKLDRDYVCMSHWQYAA